MHVALAADFVYPQTGEITADWNAKIPGGIHHAIDIKGTKGSEVVASRGGKVTDIHASNYGTSVTVAHENGYVTEYVGLGHASVAKGAQVTVGQALGRQEEPHVHFAI